jgi:hypothetical protein
MATLHSFPNLTVVGLTSFDEDEVPIQMRYELARQVRWRRKEGQDGESGGRRWVSVEIIRCEVGSSVGWEAGV